VPKLRALNVEIRLLFEGFINPIRKFLQALTASMLFQREKVTRPPSAPQRRSIFPIAFSFIRASSTSAYN
jgi:hypothetical protein